MKEYLKLFSLCFIVIFVLILIVIPIVSLIHLRPNAMYRELVLNMLSILLPYSVFASFCITAAVFIQNKFGRSDDP